MVIRKPQVTHEPGRLEVPRPTSLSTAATFTLRLWKNLKLAKTYTVAVGQPGLETPAGLYHDPGQAGQSRPGTSRLAPGPASLAGQVIPPGPDDPIKARWMGIFDGAGIHGTDETSSLGTAASHGCVRMAIPT